MRTRRYLYGLLGLLSLLGFIGIFTEERTFLAFFAFAVDFSYFFVKPDEMWEEYMNKAASLAFCCGMIATALAAAVGFFLLSLGGRAALLTGFSLGWGISVVVYALTTGFYGWREKWGLEHDPE